jgi:hypothetical protein
LFEIHVCIGKCRKRRGTRQSSSLLISSSCRWLRKARVWLRWWICSSRCIWARTRTRAVRTRS